jgi:hypothetical protein
MRYLFTIYRYLSINETEDQVTETPLKPRVNSGAPEGYAVPAPLVAHVVLILLQIQ